MDHISVFLCSLVLFSSCPQNCFCLLSSVFSLCLRAKAPKRHVMKIADLQELINRCKWKLMLFCFFFWVFAFANKQISVLLAARLCCPQVDKKLVAVGFGWCFTFFVSFCSFVWSTHTHTEKNKTLFDNWPKDCYWLSSNWSERKRWVCLPASSR